MANELALELPYGVGKENEIFELSYATFAEELQLQEILKQSMIAFEKELEDAGCEAMKKPECPVRYRLSCTECTIPQGSGLNCHEQQPIDCDELRRGHAQSSRFSCHEQQRINIREKARERIKAREHKGRRKLTLNRRRMEDIPQTSSSNEFHAKTSSRGEDGLIAGTGDTQDPKDKDVAIDDGWLLVPIWKSNSRGGNSAAKQWVDLKHPNPLKDSKDTNTNVVLEDDYDILADEDDFDSDTSQKSRGSRKKSKWFKEFFEGMEALNINEIDETLWHCPACRGGPGAIKWYGNIRDLIAHSKKTGSSKVKLHRELAELLEEELRIKGTSISAADRILGKWIGLKEEARDHGIVWPPMVVVMNTMTGNSKDGKFVGMGSRELLKRFSSYPALKAQHSYGPQGHRGLSVLIFESSAVGYLEAERLHKNFFEQGLGRFGWNFCENEVLPGGKRQLYGFMAVKEDLDFFNQHSQGKSKVKYELKSYQEAVLNEIKKMREDSKQYIRLKVRLEEERNRAKTFEESINNLSRNLQQKMEDIHIFERKVQVLHEQNKEEMESQESFYEDQIKILEARVKELEKLHESDANPMHTGEAAPAMDGLTEE